MPVCPVSRSVRHRAPIIGAVFLCAVSCAAWADDGVPGVETNAAVTEDTNGVSNAAAYNKAAETAYQQNDYLGAQSLWEKAAAAGSVDAEYSLGLLYDFGRTGNQNIGEALRWYRAAAEKGHATAALNVAILYDSGRGVPRDANAAAYWYTKAADLGQSRAMYNLGQLYENGDGVPRNDRTALSWYERASKSGLTAANERAAGLRTRIQQSASNGAVVQVSLSTPPSTTLTAEKPVVEKPAVEKSVVDKPIDAKQAERIFELGDRYARGNDVARDDAKAVDLYRAAADAGFAPAQNNLAFMYGEGRGVKQDDGEAVKWYRRAAEQEYPPAITSLGMMYQSGRGVEKSDARALVLYAKASSRGYAPATANLGAMYAEGNGVAQDNQTAAFFINMAKDQPRTGSGIYVSPPGAVQ
jgi:hypothetical protein